MILENHWMILIPQICKCIRTTFWHDFEPSASLSCLSNLPDRMDANQRQIRHRQTSQRRWRFIPYSNSIRQPSRDQRNRVRCQTRNANRAEVTPTQANAIYFQIRIAGRESDLEKKSYCKSRVSIWNIWQRIWIDPASRLHKTLDRRRNAFAKREKHPRSCSQKYETK